MKLALRSPGVTRQSNHNESSKVSSSTVVLLCALSFMVRGMLPSGFVAVNQPADLISTQSEASASSWQGNSMQNGLTVPQGLAQALPSIRINDTEATFDREFYGGNGDKAHLGGFTDIDMDGISPAVWKWMVEYFGIKSLLDVGCGRGTSTSWFHLHGVNATCVEGSHDAIIQSFMPPNQVTEHDFSRGPWWPPKTVDAIWSVELLEHIGRNFHKNLIPAFRKAALIFATHSTWGGWHHVEVHDSKWWIYKFESYGFRYAPELSQKAQDIARAHSIDLAPNGETYRAQHISLHTMIFFNPAVASLPEHHHLFAEPGCYAGKNRATKTVMKRNCGTGGNSKTRAIETKIPDSFLPITMEKNMDDAWERMIFNKTLADYLKENPSRTPRLETTKLEVH